MSHSPLDEDDGKFKQISFFIAVIANPSHSQQVSPAQFKISVQPPGSVTLLPCDATPSPDGLRVISKKSDTMDSYFEVCPGIRGRGRDASNGTVLQVSVERCSGNTDLYACDSDPSSGGTNCYTGMPRPELDDWAYRSRSNGNETCARRYIYPFRWSHENCTALPKEEHKPTLFLPYNSNSSNGGNYNIMTRGNGTFEMTVSDNSGRAFKVAPFNASDHGREVIVLGGVRGSPGTPYVVTGPITIEWHPSILIEPFQSKSRLQASIVHQAYLVDLDEKIVHHKTPNPHLHTYCGLSLAVSTLPASVINVVPLKVAIESSVPMQSVPVPDFQAQAQAQAQARVHAEKASVSYTFNSNNLSPNRKYSITVVALCDSACLKAADPKGPCRTGTCRTQTYVYAPVVVMSVVPSIPPSASTSTASILMAFTFWVVVIALIFLLATGLKVLHDQGVLANTFGYSPRDQSLSTPYVDALGGDGGRGRRWTWGYTQLGFTEMVSTSTFGSSRGISLRGVEGEECERVIDEVQPARQRMAADQASRLLANISDGTAAMAASAASLTVAAGSALSDTASALLSHFGAGSEGRERTRGRETSLTADMDSSTHPLTGGRRSRNRGGYRPPSPIPTADKETYSDTSNPIHPSPFKPENVSTGNDEVCIALTDIQSQSRARDSPLYTSFTIKNEGEKPLDEE